MNERNEWSWHDVQDWNDDMINKMNIRWYDLIWYDMSYTKDRDERDIYLTWITWLIREMRWYDLYDEKSRWMNTIRAMIERWIGYALRD